MNICGVMGRLPAEVRAMTPEETVLLVAGWNAAQQEQSGNPAPMSWDRLQELKRRYPDD